MLKSHVCSVRLITYLMVCSMSNAQKGQNIVKGATKDVKCQILLWKTRLLEMKNFVIKKGHFYKGVSKDSYII
jgi:hypothetical protein